MISLQGMNEMNRTMIASIWASLLTAALVTPSAFGQEPNDTFTTSTMLAQGVLTVSETLTPGVVSFPDTLLAVRDANGAILQIDNNSSSLGNGLASGISGAPVSDGDLFFSVSGVGDTGFAGQHTESGEFEVSLQVFNATGDPIAKFFTDPRDLKTGCDRNFPL